MALKLLVFLAILNLAISVPEPDPDPNIQIDIRQEVNAGGCCPEIEQEPSCMWDFKVYPNGAHTEDTCMILKCNKGTWEYTGMIRHGCLDCQVSGDPHFHPFDNHTWPDPPNPTWTGYGDRTSYDYQGNGTFVLTSHGLDDSNFGVNSDLVACGNGNPFDAWAFDHHDVLSCVDGASYYELGITVNLTLPYAFFDCKNSDDPLCQIEVMVNDKKVDIAKGMNLFQATDGTVAVFRHNHINKNDLNCMNVVGSKGLSLSLCTVKGDYAFLYVWAMPSLKDKTSSQLYGLCDTYTGNKPDCYTHRDGSCPTVGSTWPGDNTPELCDFAKSWALSGEAKCSPTIPSSPCDTNATLREEISAKCNATLPVPPTRNGVSRAACLFDLCRVANIASYLNGYDHHAQVDAQFAVNTCWCPPMCYGSLDCCLLCELPGN